MERLLLTDWLWAAPAHQLTLPQLAAKALVLVAAAVLAGVAVQVGRALADSARVARGLCAIPEAREGNWLLGHVVPLWLNTPWDKMAEWVLACPPLVRVRLLFRHAVIVGDPAGLKRVFQTKQGRYVKDLDFSYYNFLPILGTGLVTANGDHWQKQRLLIGPALRNDILAAIVEIARRAVDRLSVKLEAERGSGRPVDMEEEFRLLTLQVIGEAILSLPPAECDRVFPQLYLPVMEESNRRVLQPWRLYLPTPAWWAYRSRITALNSYIVDILQKRWAQRRAGAASPERPDLLHRILTAIEERGEAWSPALVTQLCYEIKTFLLAGHETSAAMLTWSLYELTQQPQALERVRSEAEAVFGASQPEREAGQEAVEGMTYTLSCLKESLRKYSVVPVITRYVAEDDEICGHPVPRGAYIICSILAVHSLWKDPSSWRPDRFLPGDEYDSFDEATRLYMFVPFIQGPRNCLGQFFALLEARVVLGLLIKRFKFTVVRKDAGTKHPRVIPIGPAHGMEMLVE